MNLKLTKERFNKIIKGLADEIMTNRRTVTNKVDKIAGKGLSTNDFTTSLKDKLLTAHDKAGFKPFPFNLKQAALNAPKQEFTIDDIEMTMSMNEFMIQYARQDKLFITKDTAEMGKFRNVLIAYTGNLRFEVVGNTPVKQLKIKEDFDKETAPVIATPVGYFGKQGNPPEGAQVCTIQFRAKTDFTGEQRFYVFITENATGKAVFTYDAHVSAGTYGCFQFIASLHKRYKVETSAATLGNINLSCVPLIPTYKE